MVVWAVELARFIRIIKLRIVLIGVTIYKSLNVGLGVGAGPQFEWVPLISSIALLGH